MRWKLALACLGVSLLAGPAAASDTSEALAVIQNFNQAANGSDPKAYAALCAEDAVFVDHVPPYIFRGPKACEDEWNAVLAWMSREKVVVSDYSRITEPSFVDATHDRVYAVYPVTASLRRGGTDEIERGSWTFVLRREPQGWRIAAVTWSTVEFQAAPSKP